MYSGLIAQAVAGEEGMYAAVGGSVGGVLLIVIIAFIIFVILRRQRYVGYSLG